MCSAIRSSSTPTWESHDSRSASAGSWPATAQDDILRGVDLEVESGTIMCVIGPNGAGKSTVLKAISGLVRCRLGSIEIGGKP